VKTDTTSVAATRKFSECPPCRGKFINVRNISYEKLKATAVCPCKNWETACKEIFTKDERIKRMSVCLYQDSKCPLSIVPDFNCSWTGNPSDIEAHIKDEHAWEVSIVQSDF
jgi:hypothetical protein